MRVIEYNDGYNTKLIQMMYDYFKEIHGDKLKGNKVTIEALIRSFEVEKTIYLLLNDKNLPIGFMVGFINDEYGMVDPHIVCEYQYIKPIYRSGNAILHLTHALAEICVKLKLPIVNTTYNSSSSTYNAERLGATTYSTTSIITLEQATTIYNKYKSRINK